MAWQVGISDVEEGLLAWSKRGEDLELAGWCRGPTPSKVAGRRYPDLTH